MVGKSAKIVRFIEYFRIAHGRTPHHLAIGNAMRTFARSIVETARHPLLILDAGFRFVAANAPYYRTFGGTPAATNGQNLFEIDAGRWNLPHLRAALQPIVLQNTSFEDLEVEIETAGGRRVLALSARRVTRDEDNSPMVLLAIEDHTDAHHTRNELRRLNAELEHRVAERTAELEVANRELLAANRELAAANRELEAFCYSVSHDLRAPLRAVDGFSQELLEGYADRLDDQGRHYLRRVRAGTQRMGQLIDDLLTLSRVTRAEMRHERVNLTALAETVAAEIREREPRRAVSFAARPGLTADCDPRLIRVVLENLLGNAWKFTSKNPAAAVMFDRTEGETPEFVIRDNGAGFDMAFANKLFGAFQRLHSDRDFPGTGIGLATAQRIVRRHGGEIRAEGAVGRGAAFFFTLPGLGSAHDG